MKDQRFSQEVLAQKLEVSQNLVSLWARGKSVPDLKQAAQLALLFGVDVNFLADDDADRYAGASLPEPDRHVLWLYRSLGISADEVARRLAGEPGGVAREAGVSGVAPTIAERDMTESAKHAEKHKRLGFELESDAEGPGAQDVPPFRRKR